MQATRILAPHAFARAPVTRLALMARPFHMARPALTAAYPPDQAPALRPTDRVAQLPSSRSAGSYHWDAERMLSVVTAGLCIAPFAVGAGNAWVDFGLAFAIPLHTHMGFDVIVTDYLPYRKFGSVYTMASWALKGLTALVIYGAYSFNTNDIGITELCKRLWNAKKEDK